MDAEPAGGLAQALDATGQLVAGVRDEQWLNPTPCPDWNVRDLVSHIIGGNRMFAGILRGERPGASGGGPAQVLAQPGRDLLGDYREAASELLAAFSRPGVLEEMFTVPFGTVPGGVALHLRISELLVHGWDLARATGQPARFPAALAEQELAFSRACARRRPRRTEPVRAAAAGSRGRAGDRPAGRMPRAHRGPAAAREEDRDRAWQ